MIYLRLFEEYRDGYYMEIEAYEYLNSVKIYFPEKDISLIKKISPYIKPFGQLLMIGSFSSEGARREIIINYLDDYWYLVKIVEYVNDELLPNTVPPASGCKYYKCDQFEGLVQLLKDKEWVW